jgi:hypothetical protein
MLRVQGRVVPLQIALQPYRQLAHFTQQRGLIAGLPLPGLLALLLSPLVAALLAKIWAAVAVALGTKIVSL